MRLMPCLRNNSYNAQQYATVLSGRSRVGSDGAEWGGRVGGYKSAMGGSRGGITVRSTCGRVNSTDATKISIRRDSSRIMATPTSGGTATFSAFYSTKLSRIPLTFATLSRAIKRTCARFEEKDLNDMFGKFVDSSVIELRSMLKLNRKHFCARYPVAYNWEHSMARTLRKGQVIVE